jgi:hypothetical protein
LKARKPKVARKKAVVSALAHFSMPVPKDHENVSTRKIDNGYIIRHDGIKGGKSFEREFFSSKAPKLDVKRKPRS